MSGKELSSAEILKLYQLRCGYNEMADTATADVSVSSRRRSSGGLRRNASHDITDQITDKKLLDLKKVASDESSFTEEGATSDGEKTESADRESEDAATSSASK
ncbi:Oidioi.mRNA.OKI2018_I69.PAR.g12219.t1.cds [Oikopleura dioica]|uniref:Oidioi.mRNA.OKI2018_I69.PAR.g12219.t1.cds n=1 Tax=Oikopleura dioica TaxID=34765 RepID=A0ABN7RZ31_OIKDI|nr:Oidioi.mRNA.OKI2018_I69.PAR.g12219.t1.cds [Oikopleura dioica]